MVRKQQYAERSYAFDTETSFGTLASPSLKELRVVDCSLDIKREYIANDEMDSSRLEKKGIAGIKRVSAKSFSFNLGDYADEIMEATLQGSFNVGTYSLTAVDVANKTITLVADANDFLPGETFAAITTPYPFRDFHVSSVTDNGDGSIDVVVVEDINPDSQIMALSGTDIAKNEVLKLGSNQKSLLFEERYEDACTSRVVSGFTPGTAGITVQPNALIKVNISNFIGKVGELQNGCTGGPSGWQITSELSIGDTSMTVASGTVNPAAGDTFCIYPTGSTSENNLSSDQVYTVSGFTAGTGALTFTPAVDIDALADTLEIFVLRPATAISTNEPYTGTDTLGSVRVGSPIAALPFSRATSIEINLDNQNQPDEVVFQDTIDSVASGVAKVSGRITHYVENMQLYKWFIEGTESSLQVRCENSSSARTITLPKIVYDDSSEENLKGSLALNQSFIAYKDDNQGTSLRIAKTPITGVSYT